MEKKEKKSSKRSNEENMDESAAKKSNYETSGLDLELDVCQKGI